MAGLINFGGLEELIHGVVENNKELAAQVQQLETTLATMASKQELQENQQSLVEALAKQERQIERLDLAAKSGQHVIDEVPSMQKELHSRMTELEQRLSTDVNNSNMSLTGRLNTVESDLRNRASVAEMRKLGAEVEERVKRDEVRDLQGQVNKVRDEASERIDDIGERTFNMRKELDERLQLLQASSESMQKAVQDRTARLEEQSTQVSTFLIKADRAINTKVTADDLERVQASFSEQLQDCRSVLQAQMMVVRERAEKIYTEFQEVWRDMKSVAFKHDIEPVAALAEQLKASYEGVAALVQLKADADEVHGQIGKLSEELGDHREAIATKADNAEVQDRHEAHVAEAATSMTSLREASEHLSISINSVQEQVAHVSSMTSTKAERHEVDEILRMNEAVQEQVASLKAELQGTLKALETWIFEQNTRKNHSMKLQPKPSAKKAESVVSASDAGRDNHSFSKAEVHARKADPSPRQADSVAPRPAQAEAPSGISEAVHMKLQRRVEELERTLRDTQQLLELRMLNPSVMVDDGMGGAGMGVPQLRPRPQKLDDSGTMLFPPGAASSPAYAGGGPAPPPGVGFSPRRRKPGGVMAATASSEGAQTAKMGSAATDDDAVGPPFRSHVERRQWLLQEKRRWLVEMRLGKTADAVSGPTSSPKLPPLLSGGANIDTIATPRCV
mmetsp:Transcript_72206/g.191929  ORF Transcript_72206/g.191929 Transcript_72206/m.191929 type:complete len:679 (+) Transcript_72206:121-2157(+)